LAHLQAPGPVNSVQKAIKICCLISVLTAIILTDYAAENP
jgi:hypothetical protein